MTTATADWPEWEDDPLVVTLPTSASRVAPTPFEWIDPTTIAPRAWLYGDHLLRRFVSLTVSPGGIGKSSLVLVEALAMTCGRALLNDDKVRTPQPLRVWYWNGEDPQDETQRRVLAAAKHHGVTAEEVGGRLFTDTGRAMAITLGSITRGEIALDEDLFVELEREITARAIDVFILDPFVSAHRLGENDNNAIDAVIKRLAALSERCNCAVEIVHHVRKPSSASTTQTDVNDARGASALLGGVRSARVLNVMPADMAGRVRIPETERFSYFQVTSGKANMSARDTDGKWRKLVSIDLCNAAPGESDLVGVVQQYVLPEEFAGLDTTPVEIARNIGRRDNPLRHWSGHGQVPKDWFGIEVGEALGMDSREDKQKIRKLITTWCSAGVLKVVEGYDGANNKVKYVVAADDPQTPTGLEDYDPDDMPF